MKTVLRVEIVVDRVKLNDVLELVQASGADGYTVIPQVWGSGSRGLRSGDECTDVFTNAMVLLACETAVWDALEGQIRPILKRYGGICLVGEVKSLLH